MQKLKDGSDVKLQARVRVHRPPSVCYRRWRDLEKLPQFMNHIESVTVLDERRSHWRVKAPADTSAEWDAEITEDIAGKRISWQSVKDSQIKNAGSVEFIPQDGGRETDVTVTLIYTPPGGVVGEWVTRLFGETPAEELEQDLSQFKNTVEMGN